MAGRRRDERSLCGVHAARPAVALCGICSDCKGRIGRSLAWGWLWSAIYVAPLALVTWGVHAALSR